MKKDKYYTLVLIPDESENPRTYRLNRKLIRTLIILSLLLVTAIAASTALIIPRALRYNDLVEKNIELTRDRFKVLGMIDDYARIKQRDIAIRKYLGLSLNLESPLGFIEAEEDSSNEKIDSLMSMPLSKINPSDMPRFGNVNFIENVPTTPPIEGVVTAGFARSTIFKEDQHIGIDIATRVGDVVVASAEGVVVFSNWTYRSGNSIILYHGDDYFSVYGHNSRNLVRVHDKVHRGDPIALGGDTGISRGPHLHFEIWKKGVPIDPRELIPIYREKDISIE